MAGTSIEPSRLTSPIQVVGAFLAALVLVEGSTLATVVAIDDPAWIRGLLGVGAFVWVPVFMAAAFLLLTRFRPQIQQDPYYAAWLSRTAPTFKDFAPDAVMARADGAPPSGASESWEEREARRVQTYEGHRGLFLIHTWRPSLNPDQEADIVIELHQHREGPLTRGEVQSVEYHLGPMFFTQPVVMTNDQDNFRLEVSAYGPMLCLARVNFVDGSPPLDLERYINF